MKTFPATKAFESHESAAIFFFSNLVKLSRKGISVPQMTREHSRLEEGKAGNLTWLPIRAKHTDMNNVSLRACEMSRDNVALVVCCCIIVPFERSYPYFFPCAEGGV